MVAILSVWLEGGRGHDGGGRREQVLPDQRVVSSNPEISERKKEVKINTFSFF